jgi:protein-S-isoprenylcysteine O-methyltransferase Ste14
VGSVGGRGGAWVAGQVAIGAVVLALGFVGPRWPDAAGWPLVVAGAALAAAGLAMLVAGGAGLGPSLTPYPRPRDDAMLIEHGVYRLVRHPIYAGALLMALGWSLATRPLALAASVVLAGYLEVKSEREETWLVERYPGYPAYRDRVRWKFVPRIR